MIGLQMQEISNLRKSLLIGSYWNIIIIIIIIIIILTIEYLSIFFFFIIISLFFSFFFFFVIHTSFVLFKQFSVSGSISQHSVIN